MRGAAREQQAGSAEAGFQTEWRRRAAAALHTAVAEAQRSEQVPEVDAYERVQALRAGMSGLLLDAQRADTEDDAPSLALG